MVIIKEEEDRQHPKPSQVRRRPNKSREPVPEAEPEPKSEPQSVATHNPYTFWFYFTLSVSIITLLFVSISAFEPQDTKTWFLSLPDSLRQHYSKGRTIKVQTRPNQSPIEVFTIEHGSETTENVVIVPGLGLSSYSFREVVRSLGSKGFRAIAIDLPGNGFSDKSTEDIVEGGNGVLARFHYLLSEIQEKGLFWAFDQMVETGQIPYEEIEARFSKRKFNKPIELGSQEMSHVLGQVISTMGLAPVHLVLHDSAFGLSANWILKNTYLIRSVTLVDTSSRNVGAFPLWVLEVPVIKELVLGFSAVYARVLNFCCTKNVNAMDADAQRVLLKGRDGRKAVVHIGKSLNFSFDMAEWGGSKGLKETPMQVLWSANWSKEWREEGIHVAEALPQANFVTHSGGRWAQEDAATELAERILEFVSSLPKAGREVEKESTPDHIQKRLDEGKHSDHHHADGGDSHSSHGHVYGPGYMEAYGLGRGHDHVHGHGW